MTQTELVPAPMDADALRAERDRVSAFLAHERAARAILEAGLQLIAVDPGAIIWVSASDMRRWAQQALRAALGLGADPPIAPGARVFCRTRIVIEVLTPDTPPDPLLSLDVIERIMHDGGWAGQRTQYSQVVGTAVALALAQSYDTGDPHA